MQCRITRRQEWTARILLESRLHYASFFITLTYSDEHLPENGSLRKSDLQNFVKRLRKNTGRKLRYFAVGEYGTRTGRAHYHAIIFGTENFGLEDRTVKGRLVSTSPEIEQAWTLHGQKLGHTSAAILNRKRARYVAGYCLKKLTDCTESDQLRLGGERGNRTPEFMICSRRPGIGIDDTNVGNIARGLDRHDLQMSGIHMIRMEGKKWPMSRTLKDKVWKKLGGDQRTDKHKALVNDTRAVQVWRDADVEDAEIARNTASAQKIYRRAKGIL